MDHYLTANEVSIALNAQIAKITDAGTCSMPIYGCSIIIFCFTYFLFRALSKFLNNADLTAFVQWPRSEMIIVASSGTSDEQTYLADDLHLLAELQLQVRKN